MATLLEKFEANEYNVIALFSNTNYSLYPDNTHGEIKKEFVQKYPLLIDADKSLSHLNEYEKLGKITKLQIGEKTIYNLYTTYVNFEYSAFEQAVLLMFDSLIWNDRISPDKLKVAMPATVNRDFQKFIIESAITNWDGVIPDNIDVDIFGDFI